MLVLARLAIALAVAAASLVPAASPAAAAGAIVVNDLGDAIALDSRCTLREALTNANGDSQLSSGRGECAAGSGSDTITFGVSGRIQLTADLPDITKGVTIDGSGANIEVSGEAAHRVFAVLTGQPVVIRGLSIVNGSADYGGGVVLNGVLTLDRVRFNANKASNDGGAVFAASLATLVIRDSTFDSNAASCGGALFLGQPAATLLVTGSTFTGNFADDGGALCNDGPVTVANSTFTGNRAQSGGAVKTLGGSLTLLNDTITGNTAYVDGGGLDAAIIALVTVKNTIIAGNIGPSGHMNVLGQLDVEAHNIVTDDTSTLLATSLADNGGPTATIRLLATATDAIDKGLASVCAAAPVSAKDQRGLARPSTCDIGAVERDKVKPATSGPSNPFATGAIVAPAPVVGLKWTGADNAGGSGIARYVLARSVNGGAWTTVSGTASSPAKLALSTGASYRFRVRAVDRDGNVGTWTYGPTFTPRVVQQSSSKVTYKGAWHTATVPGASGGTVRYADAAGASARYAFTGRSVAIVASKGPGAGKMKVYVDGVLKATVDLYAAAAQPAVQVWQRSWGASGTHAVKIAVVGTAGRPRVALDAFAILR